jgi:hypothetical protein
VTLSTAVPQVVSVKYSTANGTATSPADFAGVTNATLTFAANQTSRTISISVNGDTLDETDSDTFFVNLSSPVGIAIGDGQGIGTITDDDPPPSVSVAEASGNEGQAGQTNLNFKVSLSGASGRTAWVDYATADAGSGAGFAIAGVDYLAASGSLSFSPGQTAKTLTVKILGDSVPEGDEILNLSLSASVAHPGTLTIADGQAVGTIIDDDQAGSFQFAATNFTASEAAAAATIRVSRVNGSAGGVSVDYVLSSGSAVMGTDVSGSSTGRVSFGAYATLSTFTIPIVRDTFDEPSETLVLRLTNPVGFQAALGSPTTALLTLTDNDVGGKLQWSAAGYNAKEADGQVVLTVRRIGGGAQDVSVDYATASGSADGTDYSDTSGTLTFGPGQVSRTLLVTIAVDGSAEGKETLTATLSNPQGGASLGTIPTSTVTIADDDGTAVFFDKLAYGVNETMKNAVISVRRSGDLGAQSTVQYLASDASATKPDDYLPAAGTLTFLPNQVLKTFMVPIVNDLDRDEGPETLNLALQNASGASLGTQDAAVLTINDNDPEQVFQFAAATYKVLESAPKVILTVKRTGGTTGTVNVNYAATDGSATQPADYQLASGTLTFLPGRPTATTSVPIVNDTDAEGTHSFTVTLTLPPQPGTALGPLATATVNITDNEPTIALTSTAYKVSEAALKAVITARRVGLPLTSGASVEYLLAPGTADPATDYTAPSSGVLTFLPGKATATLEVPIVRDTKDEPPETILIQLQNQSPGPPSGYGLGTSSATLTIIDNDTAGKAQFSVAAYSVAEDGGSIAITVTRTGGTSSEARVDYATSPGAVLAATPGVHYQHASGTLAFGLNVKSQTFDVPVLNDGPGTGNHSVTLTLTGNPDGNLVLGKLAAAELWIVDVP